MTQRITDMTYTVDRGEYTQEQRLYIAVLIKAVDDLTPKMGRGAATNMTADQLLVEAAKSRAKHGENYTKRRKINEIQSALDFFTDPGHAQIRAQVEDFAGVRIPLEHPAMQAKLAHARQILAGVAV